MFECAKGVAYLTEIDKVIYKCPWCKNDFHSSNYGYGLTVNLCNNHIFLIMSEVNSGLETFTFFFNQTDSFIIVNNNEGFFQSRCDIKLFNIHEMFETSYEELLNTILLLKLFN